MKKLLMIASVAATLFALQASASEMKQLKDGTNVVVDESGAAWIMAKDGSKVAASDGVHALSDDTTLVVEHGKVKDSAVVVKEAVK